MRFITEKRYQRSGSAFFNCHCSRTRALSTFWRRLCILLVLLCGAVTADAQALGDLNGDGKDDVLLRNEDGRWWYYPMDGRRHIVSGRGYADLTRNLAWQFVGIGGFNGDGKDEVLLRHENGRWFYYPMDGRRHIVSGRGYADLTPNLAWQFAGIGDLNGDGKDDVLVRHENGRWFYYPMDGRRHNTGVSGFADLTRNLAWSVAGIGDLNGDGKDDVLLRHENGSWFYYPMNSRSNIPDQRGYANLTRNRDWQVAGISDLNGDGKDDVLLRHEDGRWWYYPMDGRNHIVSGRGYADLTRNLAWQFAGIGDLNGDGKDEVLLRHENGRWFYYPMDGRRHIVSGRGYADLTRNLAWSIAAAETPPDDGSMSSEVVMLPGGVSVEMVSIPGGTFRMGDNTTFRLQGFDEHLTPEHNVTVPAFRMGKYEVTFALWDACVADGGCYGYRPVDEGWGRGNRPVIVISWHGAQQGLIDWLNLKTGSNYRLPTEAEWEYAARAGSTTKYPWGDDIAHGLANCREPYCGDGWVDKTAPVGSFPANAWGLHDMIGNVAEWVQDCWHENYKGAPTDGSAWTSGGDCDERVVRGGSYAHYYQRVTSASRSRSSDADTGASGLLGFRLAQDK